LNWSQYKVIIRLDSEDKRNFYIAETIKNNWTVRQLERQIHSSLWERLLMSNDKDSVLAAAQNEKQPSDAKEIIKYPMYLEFLGYIARHPITKKTWSNQSLHICMIFY